MFPILGEFDEGMSQVQGLVPEAQHLVPLVPGLVPAPRRAEVHPAVGAARVEAGPRGAALGVGEEDVGIVGQPVHAGLGGLQGLHAVVAGVVAVLGVPDVLQHQDDG